MHNQTGIHHGVKLRHLRVFLAIAAGESLTAAARRQGLTQPALSRSLAELEALLGQPLFTRQGRRLVLSEAGALFRRHAASALAALDAGAGALQPGVGGRLRVGVLPTVATWFFPRLVLKLRELRPDLVLAVETGPHHYLLRELRSGSIDCMIGRLPVASEMAGLRFGHLYEEDIVLVARAGHPLTQRFSAGALAAAPLIMPPATALIRPMVEAYLASLGLPEQQPAVETVSLALGRGLCLSSDMVWFISAGVVRDELDSGRLVRLPVDARFMSGSVGLTCRQSDAPPGLQTLEIVAQDIAASV